VTGGSVVHLPMLKEWMGGHGTRATTNCLAEYLLHGSQVGDATTHIGQVSRVDLGKLAAASSPLSLGISAMHLALTLNHVHRGTGDRPASRSQNPLTLVGSGS
jgi:hypothetical protein